MTCSIRLSGRGSPESTGGVSPGRLNWPTGRVRDTPPRSPPGHGTAVEIREAAAEPAIGNRCQRIANGPQGKRKTRLFFHGQSSPAHLLITSQNGADPERSWLIFRRSATCNLKGRTFSRALLHFPATRGRRLGVATAPSPIPSVFGRCLDICYVRTEVPLISHRHLLDQLWLSLKAKSYARCVMTLHVRFEKTRNLSIRPYMHHHETIR